MRAFDSTFHFALPQKRPGVAVEGTVLALDYHLYKLRQDCYFDAHF